MRETSIMDHLTCTIQVSSRLWEDSKLRKNDYPLKEFLLKDQPSGTSQKSPKKWILVCLLTCDNAP